MKFQIPGFGWQWPHLQPIKRRNGGKTEAYELLLRKAENGVIIPHARHLARIPMRQIDNALLAALRQIPRRNWEQTIDHCPLSINLAATTLLDRKTNIHQELARLHKTLPGGLLVELHEQSYPNLHPSAILILRRLRNLGIRVLLDDVSHRLSPNTLQGLLPVIDGFKIDVRRPPRRDVAKMLRRRDYPWQVAECGIPAGGYRQIQSYQTGKPEALKIQNPLDNTNTK